MDQLIGSAKGWRPLSLDPEATRRSAAALFVPAAVLIGSLQATNRGLLLIARAIVLGALFSALFGAVQSALGSPGYLSLYDRPEARNGAGFFANPNHQAQLMLAGILSTSLLIRLEKPQVNIHTGSRRISFHFGWFLFPIFVMGVIATESRAGLMMMFAAIAAAILIARSPERGGVFLALLSGFVLVSVVAFAFVPEAVTSAMRLQSIMMGEGRIINLPDILFTVRQYWPWGAGFGTFVPIFMANENLDLLTGPYLNRAHNDLLELLIEAGLPGAILLGIVLVLIGVRLARVVRMRTALIPALAGFGTLALMLVHSLVDYPLRTDAITAVAAVAIALFVSPAQKADRAENATRRRIQKGFGGPRSQSGTAGLSKRRTR